MFMAEKSNTSFQLKVVIHWCRLIILSSKVELHITHMLSWASALEGSSKIQEKNRVFQYKVPCEWKASVLITSIIQALPLQLGFDQLECFKTDAFHVIFPSAILFSVSLRVFI